MKIRYSLLLFVSGLMISCQTIDTQSNSPSKSILRAMLESRDTRWTEEYLNIPSENAGWREIKNVSELAFLLEFGSTSGEKYRLMADLDVATSEIADKFSSEIGIENFSDFEFDGNGKTISGLDLPRTAALFSRVKDAKIYNIIVCKKLLEFADNMSIFVHG